MKTLIVALILGLSTSVASQQTDDLTAARDARDRGSVTELQRLVTQSRQKALKSRSSAAYAHLALLHMWLCEAIESSENKALFKKTAEDGVAAAEKAVALNPKSSDAHWLLGDLLNQLIPHVYGGGMRYGQRANAELDRAIALNPKNANAYVSRAISYHYTPESFGGSKTKATEFLKKATELDPSADSPHIWLALFHLEAQDKEAATREITLALDANPNRSFARFVNEQVKAMKTEK
jgi:tetratricopeptide (TPR) repeat protein